MQKVQIKSFISHFQAKQFELRKYKFIHSIAYDPRKIGPKQPKLFKMIGKTKYIDILETFDPFVKQTTFYVYLFKRISKYLKAWSSFFLDKRNLFYSRKVFKCLKNLKEMKSTSVSPIELRYLPHLTVLKLIGYTHNLYPRMIADISRKKYLANLTSLGMDTRTFDQSILWLYHLNQNNAFLDHLEELYLSWSTINQIPIDWKLWEKLKSVSVYFNKQIAPADLITNQLTQLPNLNALGLTFKTVFGYQREVMNALKCIDKMRSLSALNIYLDLNFVDPTYVRLVFDSIKLPPNLSVIRLQTISQNITDIITSQLLSSINKEKVSTLSLKFEGLESISSEEISLIQSAFDGMRNLHDLELILSTTDKKCIIDIGPLFDSLTKLFYLKTLKCEFDAKIYNSGLKTINKFFSLEAFHFDNTSGENTDINSRIQLGDIYPLFDSLCIRSIHINDTDQLNEEEIIRRLKLISRMKNLRSLVLKLSLKNNMEVTPAILLALNHMISTMYYLSSINIAISGTYPLDCEEVIRSTQLLLKHNFKFLCEFRLDLGGCIISS